jgi:hypothetical protein
MSSEYHERLGELETLMLEKRHSVDNLSGVPFVIFPYPPEKELSVEDDIDGFIDKLQFNELNVAEIDLRDTVFTLLKEESLLENVIEVEKSRPDDLREGLNSAFFEEVGGEHGKLINTLLSDIEGNDVAVVYRCGVLYPFSSLSVILGQLENVVETPLVVFYPAVKENKSLRFLDETEGNYYRARVI